MADASDVLGIVAVGTGVNAIAVASSGRPEASFGVVFGGLAMFATLAAVGQFYDWRLARNFAALFLLGSLLFRGDAFFDWWSRAVGSATK